MENQYPSPEDLVWKRWNKGYFVKTNEEFLEGIQAFNYQETFEKYQKRLNIVWTDNELKKSKGSGGFAEEDHLRDNMGDLSTVAKRVVKITDEKKAKDLINVMHNKIDFIITSGAIGKTLVKWLYEKYPSLIQYYQVFVFCRTTNFHKKWANNYGIVRDVVNKFDPILQAIKKYRIHLPQIKESFLIRMDYFQEMKEENIEDKLKSPEYMDALERFIRRKGNRYDVEIIKEIFEQSKDFLTIHNSSSFLFQEANRRILKRRFDFNKKKKEEESKGVPIEDSKKVEEKKGNPIEDSKKVEEKNHHYIYGSQKECQDIQDKETTLDEKMLSLLLNYFKMMNGTKNWLQIDENEVLVLYCTYHLSPFQISDITKHKFVKIKTSICAYSTPISLQKEDETNTVFKIEVPSKKNNYLFPIEVNNDKNIKNPKEKEVLFPPGSFFEIKERTHMNNDIFTIALKFHHTLKYNHEEIDWKKITSLDASFQNSFVKNHFEEILQAKELISLNLCGTDLNFSQIESLLKKIKEKEFTQLNYLNLGMNYIQDCAEILNDLNQTTVKRIDLGCNLFSDSDSKVILEDKKDKCLELNLFLASNNINNENDLNNLMGVFRYVKKLNLSSNQIPLRKLNEANFSDKLQCLNLSNCNLGIDDLWTQNEGKHFPIEELEELNLSWNCFSTEEVFKCISNQIVKLDLSGNYLQVKELSNIEHWIEANDKLRELNLEYNMLETSSAKDLIFYLRKNSEKYGGNQFNLNLSISLRHNNIQLPNKTSRENEKFQNKEREKQEDKDNPPLPLYKIYKDYDEDTKKILIDMRFLISKNNFNINLEINDITFEAYKYIYTSFTKYNLKQQAKQYDKYLQSLSS